MTEELLKSLNELPGALDELSTKIQAANTRLREQVLATKKILLEMGIQGPQVVVASPVHPVPVPPPVQSSQNNDEAREEQLRYLETRRAERQALVDQMRGATNG